MRLAVDMNNKTKILLVSAASLVFYLVFYSADELFLSEYKGHSDVSPYEDQFNLEKPHTQSSAASIDRVKEQITNDVICQSGKACVSIEKEIDKTYFVPKLNIIDTLVADYKSSLKEVARQYVESFNSELKLDPNSKVEMLSFAENKLPIRWWEN